MLYLKSVTAGLAGALLAGVLMLVLQALAFALLSAWHSRAADGGVFVAFASFPNPPVLVFAAAGFVFGFWWTQRQRSL